MLNATHSTGIAYVTHLNMLYCVAALKLSCLRRHSNILMMKMMNASILPKMRVHGANMLL